MELLHNYTMFYTMSGNSSHLLIQVADEENTGGSHGPR